MEDKTFYCNDCQEYHAPHEEMTEEEAEEYLTPIYLQLSQFALNLTLLKGSKERTEGLNALSAMVMKSFLLLPGKNPTFGQQIALLAVLIREIPEEAAGLLLAAIAKGSRYMGHEDMRKRKKN